MRLKFMVKNFPNKCLIEAISAVGDSTVCSPLKEKVYVFHRLSTKNGYSL